MNGENASDNNYWFKTAGFLKKNNGKIPICPIHKEKMTMDDNGIPSCFKCGINKSYKPEKNFLTEDF